MSCNRIPLMFIRTYFAKIWHNINTCIDTYTVYTHMNQRTIITWAWQMIHFHDKYQILPEWVHQILSNITFSGWSGSINHFKAWADLHMMNFDIVIRRMNEIFIQHTLRCQRYYCDIYDSYSDWTISAVSINAQ